MQDLIQALQLTTDIVIRSDSPRYWGKLSHGCSVVRYSPAGEYLEQLSPKAAELLILDGSAVGFDFIHYRGYGCGTVRKLEPFTLKRCWSCGEACEPGTGDAVRTVFGEYVCRECYHNTKTAYSYSPATYYRKENARIAAWEKRNPLTSFAKILPAE